MVIETEEVEDMTDNIVRRADALVRCMPQESIDSLWWK